MPQPERVVQLLSDLVAHPTESRTPNRALIDWVGDHLTAFGARVAVVEGPLGRANLVASVGPAIDGGVLLSGHSDVVPAGGGWSSDPFTLTETAIGLVGRGSADMKGFIACTLALVESVDVNALQRPLHLVLSYDEEVGCVGVRDVLEQLADACQLAYVRPDLVVIGEPTMMRPRHSHLGKVSYRLSFRANSGHSSLSPLLPSAIHAAARVVAAILGVGEAHVAQATRDHRGEATADVTVNIGTIQGGSAVNVLAEQCELTFEIRHSAAFNPDDLLAPVWLAVMAEQASLACVDGGIERAELSRYPALATDPSNRWARVVERVADRGPSTPIGFGSEGGLFAEALDAAVIICGPGDIAVAHRPDEYVSREQLRGCSQFLAQLVEAVCC